MNRTAVDHRYGIRPLCAGVGRSEAACPRDIYDVCPGAVRKHAFDHATRGDESQHALNQCAELTMLAVSEPRRREGRCVMSRGELRMIGIAARQHD